MHIFMLFFLPIYALNTAEIKITYERLNKNFSILKSSSSFNSLLSSCLDLLYKYILFFLKRAYNYNFILFF